MRLFDDKVVVITGATSGIGTASARMFAREGAKVILVGRSVTKGKALEAEIRSENLEAEFLCCDVSQEKDVENLARLVEEKYHQVDILFNNAGVMLTPGELERVSVDEWTDTFDINVNGVFYVTRYFKPLIYKCKGNIINNASIAGMHSYVTGRSYAYSASKAAIIQFTRQMAKNYAPDGVRVNCICPGVIDTPILGDRDRKIYAERIPMGYVGAPEDVAKVVVFLASENASYITGVVLPIDGGTSL